MLKLQNKLGDIRAESDREMLDVAFIETPEYKGIVETRDFNFIVGRRGTGKSALKYSAVKYLSANREFWIFDIQNPAHGMLAMQSLLQDLNAEYRHLNYIMTIVSEVAINLEIIKELSSYYKKKHIALEKELSGIYAKYNDIITLNFYTRCARILNSASSSFEKPIMIPEKIAQLYNIELIKKVVEASLTDINRFVILFFDNLDEGWTPKPLETSIIGGLARATSMFKDRQSRIHNYIFSRDNMFRAIASLDNDFTRNIEGAVVRLKWDDSSLFNLVAERIKYSFKIDAENNTKIWNRVAKNDLSNRDGFKLCTNKTLHRPRDILSLLNQAFILAIKDSRNEIIYNDVELAAKEISLSRLHDLSSEYKDVFPSLDILIESLKNATFPCSYSNILEIFQETIEHSNFSPTVVRDFGIFSSAEDCFLALYSIGFIGIDMKNNGQIMFCHDGTSASLVDSMPSTAKVWPHPCYWEALSLDITESIDVISSIYDDYSAGSSKQEMADLRMKQIGAVITDIGRIIEGKAGASEYEEWVLRCVKILFHNDIGNPQLHPNGASVTKRDVVGTINATKGFWARVNNDYKCRQIIFEAKNYGELELTDIRQLADYLSDNYGNFGIIVPRRKQEALTNVEIAWVKDMWHRHSKMIFIIPDSFLIQCISKQRSKHRYDYTEKQLSKKLDTFERSYIAIRHG